MDEQDKQTRFQELIMPHLDAAYNLAHWLIRNASDAEDVVQEAFLRAFKFFDGFHGGNSRAWLLAIVRHTSYDWLRANRQIGGGRQEHCSPRLQSGSLDRIGHDVLGGVRS
jgi:RNA polymerase sigma-70 factor (ECF subfamily)